MQHVENCIIKKGWFPETAKGIDEQFIFVSLDMDLYEPTLSGLNFFSKKMKAQGIILVHDYFNNYYSEVRKAVDEWIYQNKDFYKIPIGDNMSIAIVGFKN